MPDDVVSQVFAAHKTCGWVFRAQAATKTGSSIARITPPQHMPAHAPAELASCAHAYGLQTASDACNLWGVSGCQPDHASALQLLLWQVMGTVSCARLAASALESNDWTAAALYALEVILGNLSRGFKSVGPWRHGLGGREANRLLQNLQGSLEGLQSQMKPSAKIGDATLAAESAVLVIARLDEAYYALLEHHLSCGHETPSVPPPHVYLPAIIAANLAGNADACKRMVRERAPYEGKQLLRKVWGVRKVCGQLALPDQATANNPLLTVMWARFQEGCRLLYASGLGLQGEMDAAAAAEDKRIRSRAERRARPGSQAALLQGSAKYCRETPHITKRPRLLQADGDGSSADVSSTDGSEEKQSGDASSDASSADDISDELAPAWRDGAAQPGESPWPAHRALREWRQAGRECHLYAYAPYTREALDALAERAPLLEVGAGLGYWAAALRAGGVPVLALDSHPPGGATSNNYHGRIPSFTKVAQGGPKAVAGHSERHTLFLCYPPPGSPMAADCLRYFRGDCVCVVGEWLGDTADESFAAALLAGWRLVRRVPLPNWTDTAHELTIWQRNDAKSSANGSSRPRKIRTKARHAKASQEVQSLSSVGKNQAPSHVNDERLNSARPAAGVSGSGEKVAKKAGGKEASGDGSTQEFERIHISSCSACGSKQGAPKPSKGAKGLGGQKSAEIKQQKHEKVALRRCCYCREATYCSAACVTSDAAWHADSHALRLVFFQARQLDFDSPVDFALLPL